MPDSVSNKSIRVGGDGKNIVVAYLLWWFLGVVGVHRFYLDRPMSGLAQIILLILGIPTLFIAWIILGIWWLLDAYFVYRYVEDYNLTHDGAPLAVSIKTTQTVKGDLELLERIHALHVKGILTEEEYLSHKKDIL